MCRDYRGLGAGRCAIAISQFSPLNCNFPRTRNFKILASKLVSQSSAYQVPEFPLAILRSTAIQSQNMRLVFGRTLLCWENHQRRRLDLFGQNDFANEIRWLCPSTTEDVNIVMVPGLATTAYANNSSLLAKTAGQLTTCCVSVGHVGVHSFS